jgi:hypothetical protein
MNQAFGYIIEAIVIAAAYGLFWLMRKVWLGLKSLSQSFTRISDGLQSLQQTNGEMLEGFKEVSLQLKQLIDELAFLRTVVTGTPPEAEPGATQPPVAPRGPGGKPIPSFPAWQPFVAAVDVPDAEESDTQVIDTTDAELVEMEQIDTIRGQGFAAGPEADPTQNPPGVTAEV